jgi:hypothetical protein
MTRRFIMDEQSQPSFSKVLTELLAERDKLTPEERNARRAAQRHIWGDQHRENERLPEISIAILSRKP